MSCFKTRAGQGSREGLGPRWPDSRSSVWPRGHFPKASHVRLSERASRSYTVLWRSRGTRVQMMTPSLRAFSNAVLSSYIPEDRADGTLLPSLTSSFHQRRSFLLYSLWDFSKSLASFFFCCCCFHYESRMQHFQKPSGHRALFH